MKCQLCKAFIRGKSDLERHAEVVHKMTLDQYRLAIRAQSQGVATMIGVVKRSAILAVALLLVGCQQFRRLTGGDDHNDPVNIDGYWIATVGTGTATLLMGQHDAELSGAAVSESDPRIHGQISGHVDGHDFAIVVDEGSACVEKIHINGEERGGELLVTITAKGNVIPGTTCYPSAINVSTVFHK